MNSVTMETSPGDGGREELLVAMVRQGDAVEKRRLTLHRLQQVVVAL